MNLDLHVCFQVLYNLYIEVNQVELLKIAHFLVDLVLNEVSPNRYGILALQNKFVEELKDETLAVLDRFLHDFVLTVFFEKRNETGHDLV